MTLIYDNKLTLCRVFKNVFIEFALSINRSVVLRIKGIKVIIIVILHSLLLIKTSLLWGTKYGDDFLNN